MSKEGLGSEVAKVASMNQTAKDSRKGDNITQMTKGSYLKFLDQLLREHYAAIKESGSVSSNSQQFLNGYLTAARTLHAVYQKELNEFAEKVHFEIFNMTIAERKKTMQVELSEEELDIPTYMRKGIRLKF
jgi:hypothetical protein